MKKIFHDFAPKTITNKYKLNYSEKEESNAIADGSKSIFLA